jgi:phospholipid/cholesterol/gamma-HCH transport system permease protein
VNPIHSKIQVAVEDAKPRICLQASAQGQSALLLGRWTATQLADAAVWEAIAAVLRPRDAVQALAGWDLRQMRYLDHVGAQLLWDAWGRRWPQELSALPQQRAMLERVARFSGSVPPARSTSLRQWYLGLGAWIYAVASHAKGMLQLVGQLALDLLHLARAPSRAPWRDLSGHLYRVGATALPITALVGFLVGVVLAYLMSQQLRQFGADTFIVNILGISLVRELGPVLAAVLLAGRSGSAITAQIGVMRVTEELDAMRVMGISLSYRLVLPRALAMALAMPLVALWTTLAALLGGMLAAQLSVDLSMAYFVSALPRVVRLSNLWLLLSKSAIFGLLIALVACHYGLRVKPNTQSLGRGTTASVVTSITVVILVDALFAVLFKGVGL